MLHPLVRWLGRRALNWFYGDVELLGGQAIPASGATLLLVNHGNDLPDVLLTFLSTPRDVLFVANVTAADSAIVNWTYRGLGVIPVSRVRDTRALRAQGKDPAGINALAFERVAGALKAGHIVVVFPEGTVHDLPHLAPFRTGAAIMALQCINSGVKNLNAVPLGHQYEKSREPRSGVLSVVGAPIELSNWKAEQPEKAATELTRAFRSALQEVTRNAGSFDDLDKQAVVAAVTGAAISTDSISPLAASHSVQKLVSMVGNGPDASASLRESATILGKRLAMYGARPWSASDCCRVLHGAGDEGHRNTNPSWPRVYGLFPLALLGWILHLLPIALNWRLGRRLARNRTEIAARTIIPGLYVFVLWYVSVPVLLVLSGVSPWLALLVFVSQPRLGDLALQWRDDMRAHRLRARVRSAPPAEREAIVNGARSLRKTWSTLMSAQSASNASASSFQHPPVAVNHSVDMPVPAPAPIHTSEPFEGRE